MRPTLFSFLFVCLFLSLTQTGYSQNPAAYAHVSNWTNFAEFHLKETDRVVLHEKGVTFEVTEEVAMMYQVLVSVDGKVKFVRPPRCEAKFAEYRLGGTDALYGFQFAPIDSLLGEQWINVEMLVYPDGATRQAQ